MGTNKTNRHQHADNLEVQRLPEIGTDTFSISKEHHCLWLHCHMGSYVPSNHASNNLSSIPQAVVKHYQAFDDVWSNKNRQVKRLQTLFDTNKFETIMLPDSGNAS
jgi:hypothetical protein